VTIFVLTRTPSLLYSSTWASLLDVSLLFFIFPVFLISAFGFLRFFGFFASMIFLPVFLGFFRFSLKKNTKQFYF
jgi:hypothetical protein